MTPDDIVKRLRRRQERFNHYSESGMVISDFRPDKDCQEAADLIERQAKALEEAEKALKVFAEPAGIIADGFPDHDLVPFRLGQCRDACHALATIRAARGETK